MTLEEAMHIASNRLPEEPEDALTNWQAARPPPEPPKRPRGLDTSPVDWPAEIRKAASRERALIVEAVGQALGEHGNAIIGEVEQMIAAAVDQVRSELRAEFAGQISELSARIDLAHTQGNELRAQLEEIIAKKRRAKAAKPNGSRLLLPGPNGNAQHGPQ